MNHRHDLLARASDETARLPKAEQSAPDIAPLPHPGETTHAIMRNIPFNLLTVIVTLLGVLLVGGGYAIRGDTYWAGVAQQSGSELLLVIPLLLVGRSFENRLRKTEENTREMAGDMAAVRASLDATVARIDAQADASLSERLRTRRVTRVDYFEQAAMDPRYEAIAGLFAAAYQTKAIHHDGVRIKVPNTDLRFKFNYSGESSEGIRIQLQNQAGSEIMADFLWNARDSRAQLARRIASSLKTVTTAEIAVAHTDLAAILRSLAQLLYAATAAKTGETAFDLGSVVEIVNSQWVIAGEGVRAQGHSAHLSVAQLLPSIDDKSVSLLLRKPWVDRTKLLEAIELARMILSPTAGSDLAPDIGLDESPLQ